MGKTNISIREVDEKTFRKFRSKSIENRLKLGEALTKAMQKMVDEMESKKTKIKKPKVKPFSWGEGTERTSEKIDEILYK